MTHTILAFDGFETRGGKAIPSGAFSASALQHFYSDYSLLWAPAGGASSLYGVTALNADGMVVPTVGGDYTWASFHFYIDNLPGAGQYAMFCGMNDYIHIHSGCRIKGDGSLSLWNSTAWGADSAAKLVAGRWYQMSYHNVETVGGEIRLIVRDPVTLSEVANITAAQASADDLIFFFFGGTAAAGMPNNYGVYYYDNFVWEGAAAAANVDDPFLLLGCNYAEWILPVNGVGTDNDVNWSGSYLDVDEVPNDGDTTYRACNAGGTPAFTCMTTDPAVAQPAYKIDTVPAVMAQTMGRRFNGSGAGTKLRLRRGAVTSDTAAWAGTTYTWQLRLWALDPTDSAAWTETRVNELEVGAVADSCATGTNFTTCQHLTILVTIRTLAPVAQRILDYILDVNEDGQPIRNQAGEIVPPEEVMPNTWIAIVGWRTPDAEAYSDYMDNPEMMPVISRKFTAPDDVSLTSGTDDLPEVMIARLTQRSTA